MCASVGVSGAKAICCGSKMLDTIVYCYRIVLSGAFAVDKPLTYHMHNLYCDRNKEIKHKYGKCQFQQCKKACQNKVVGCDAVNYNKYVFRDHMSCGLYEVLLACLHALGCVVSSC